MRGIPNAFAVAALLVASSASAQERPAGRAKTPPPRWDIVASAGYLFTPDAEAGSPYLGYSRLEFQASAARYWNTRVRSEVGFSTTTRDDGYEWEDLAGFGSVAVDRLVRVYTGFAAVSYAFFEDNLFIRPYVSAGLRVGALSEHLSRYQSPDAYRRGVTVRSNRAEALALPFVAAGVTSFMSARTFTRSELVTAFGSRGFEHATLRVGVGVYF